MRQSAPGPVVERQPDEGPLRRAGAQALRERVGEPAGSRIRGTSHQRVQRRHHCAIPLDVLRHRLGLAVPTVGAAQCRVESFGGLSDSEGRIEVGQRVQLHPVRLAGFEQLSLVGEVVVHGQALHAGSASNLGDRRLRGADLPVQVHRREHDALPRLPLGLCAGLELVFPFFD